jgi:GntP family gluconate:H+ symporter
MPGSHCNLYNPNPACLMLLLAQAATTANESTSYWPLGILAISVVLIVLAIVQLRVHPFIALIVAAVTTGLLSKSLPDPTTENIGIFKARTDIHLITFEKKPSGTVEARYNKGEPISGEEIGATVSKIKGKYKDGAYLTFYLVGDVEAKQPLVAEAVQAADANKVPFTLRHRKSATHGSKLLNALNWSLRGFGDTAGGIGLVVALAAIIGTCMMGSGAADKIVRALLAAFGEARAGLVLLSSGFLLSIPVFFDTVFFLLIPLARALSLRTGKHYTLYVLAMAGAGAITHSMVPPTPGPLMIADGLCIDLGIAMMAGLVASILPAWLVLSMSKAFDKKFDIPMRDAVGESHKELESIVDKKDSELPGLFLSSIPVAFPVIIISLVSILDLMKKNAEKLVDKAIKEGIAPPESFLTSDGFKGIFEYLQFFGKPEVAMFIAAAFAILTYAQQLLRENPALKGNLSRTLHDKMEAPLLTAGVIILITGAGGAFGGMIRLAGVGETIEALANQFNISYILLAWCATAVVRIAQGSATVAMITGVGLMSAVIGDGSMLEYHPLYVFLAIGFGSITLSWMNDSGFWVVQKLSGFTEKETLKTWSVLLTAIAVLGLVQLMVMSKILPLKPEAKANKEQAALVIQAD